MPNETIKNADGTDSGFYGHYEPERWVVMAYGMLRIPLPTFSGQYKQYVETQLNELKDRLYSEYERAQHEEVACRIKAEKIKRILDSKEFENA